MLNINKIKKYLEENVGKKTVIVPLEKRFAQALPMYILAIFELFETEIFGQKICLLVAKTGENKQTPATLAKQADFITQKIEFPVVFVFEKVLSYNLKRFVLQQINFIVPDKQLFIPALLLNLRKTSDKPQLAAHKLTSNAQFLLLYHLQKKSINRLTTKQLSEKFNQNYRTISRAVNCLYELGLLELLGGKEKQIVFTEKGKNLWQKAQPYFQNPVERTLFTDKILNLTKSNTNALAHYTMLNDEQKQYYAIDKQGFKNLKVETNKYAGDNEIEIWRYNPTLLAENDFVDKLSLYLLLKNTDNERIEIELETLINEIQWLEE